MRIQNVKQQLDHIQAYDRLVETYGLDKNAQLLELQRFIGEQELWPELIRFLNENYSEDS
jgi:predicted Mrr-cat superfamily restriction endonuclease